MNCDRIKEKRKKWKWQERKEIQKKCVGQAILEAYQPQTAQEMNNALKDLFGPLMESMLQGELNHHLGYESLTKAQRKMLTEEMAMERRYSRQHRGKWRLRCPEIVTGHLNLSWYKNARETSQPLNRRYSQCTPEGCHSEIYPQRSKISMASRCLMR